MADARSIPLAAGCVQCVVTSPPYFGLRDYGTARQIGLEPTPDAYVGELVAVFREVRRVLAADGVVWLNLGDSYANSASGRTQDGFNARYFGRPDWERGKQSGAASTKPERAIPDGLKPKDLLGIPWRVALALQCDGWYLRSDVIWHKPNPMPESVTDRPTKAHEYVFLLAKSERYYYDANAIKEPAAYGGEQLGIVRGTKRRAHAMGVTPSGNERPGADAIIPMGRNKRTVWTIATKSYTGAHFATMPEALIEPCILAGSRFGEWVFDPFIGSGTLGAVAERLGRRWVGTDINPQYHDLARVRTAQRGLMFTATEDTP